MPANRNALIRYKTIDACLRNRYRKWTLEDLIEKVSEAMYEYEGMDKGISRRTIQADLQMMRSDKLGYFAPIIVVDKKYYTYEDPTYSITQIPLTELDLQRMNEAVEVLRQFKGFSHFQQLTDVIQKLEGHVYAAKHHQRTVIDFEKNENLRGLSFLETLYQAVVQQKAVSMTYQSFRAREANHFTFHVWWLKEYKNRWFAVGVRHTQTEVFNLALDRIIECVIDENTPFRANEQLTPEEFYQHVIGVTVQPNQRPRRVRLWVAAAHAPYLETKPLHSSQVTLERQQEGVVIELFVQLNFELEKEILGFGEIIKVLSPDALRKRIQQRLKEGAENYE
ncbi:helix-turn-helix transcriptional regulator [Runella limosa]|uniref:helix-turn-helix transcriptional regulator n=1 Tax=Runella limosa TaxID=370978 RepID=UPI0004043628|nr:WYL domain-containing protein [Runella limosa]